MRVVVTEYLSLDGVIEDPEWIGPYFSDDFNQVKFDELMSGDALLMGRKTYEYFRPAWVSATAEDDSPGQEGFADRIHDLPKYVVSSTLDKSDWNNVRFIHANIVEEVSKLKQQPGQNILVAGSAELIQTLIEHDLVDEYRFLVYPVVVGSGKKLFQSGQNLSLKLVEATPLSTGVVLMVYQPENRS
jgi:dihydrofolate reductase